MNRKSRKYENEVCCEISLDHENIQVPRAKICMKKLKNDSFCEYTQSTRNSMNRKSGKYENEWQRRVEKMSSARPPRVVGRGGGRPRGRQESPKSRAIIGVVVQH